jgi:hypothetical protein
MTLFDRSGRRRIASELVNGTVSYRFWDEQGREVASPDLPDTVPVHEFVGLIFLLSGAPPH